MRRIQEKLGSRKGASITFALLLFLVCAVASSVVIVAGSTAAGRMSEQARTDQRYYAVASAVELLREDFNNKTVVVTDTRSEDAPNIDTGATTVSTTDMKKPLKVSDHKILSRITENLVLSIIKGKDTESLPTMMKLTAEISDPDLKEKAALDCDIKAFVKRDGRAVFQVSNATTTGNNKKYTLTVTFTATISESKSTVGGQTTHTTTVDWRLGDIRKGAIEEGG